MYTFGWPAAFLLLPLFWLVQTYLPKVKKNNELMLRAPLLDRIARLSENTPPLILPNRIKHYLALMIWFLLVIACANPKCTGKAIFTPQNSRNIMLAIDLSQSMSIPDLQVNNRSQNRLQTLKAVAADFIEKREGDKLGLILFGSKAYLQTPLTFDRKTVRVMLDDATIGLAGERTAIGDAIGLAVKKFNDEKLKSRILILFTDGGNNAGTIEPLEAARLAKENQIKIYTVGIGATQMVMPNIFGAHLINPSADLDEESLKKIAELTNGKYFRAQDDATLANILDAINELEAIHSTEKPIHPITYLFYWPLTLALCLITVFLFPKFYLYQRL